MKAKAVRNPAHEDGPVGGVTANQQLNGEGEDMRMGTYAVGLLQEPCCYWLDSDLRSMPSTSVSR